MSALDRDGVGEEAAGAGGAEGGGSESGAGSAAQPEPGGESGGGAAGGPQQGASGGAGPLEESENVSGAAAIFGPFFNAIVAPARCWEVLSARPLLSLWIVVWVGVFSLGLGLWNLPITRQAFTAVTRAQLQAQGAEMTPEQLSRMQSVQEITGSILAWASPVFVLLMIAIIALLLWLGASLMGGGATFSRAFALASAGAVIHPLLYSVYSSVILHMNPPEIRRVEDMMLMAPSIGLDLLFPGAELPVWMMVLLSRIDLFNIWWIVLVASGSTALLGLKKGQGYAVALLVWVLTTGVALIGPIFQSMAS